jgi:hypothetical protein
MDATFLPPITALLRDCDPDYQLREAFAASCTIATSREKHWQECYTAEELVEFHRMGNNREYTFTAHQLSHRSSYSWTPLARALDQRRSAGQYAPQTGFVSRSPGSSFDPMIKAVILGSPRRRLRLFDIERAIKTRYGVHLTRKDIVSTLFVRFCSLAQISYFCAGCLSWRCLFCFRHRNLVVYDMLTILIAEGQSKAPNEQNVRQPAGLCTYISDSRSVAATHCPPREGSFGSLWRSHHYAKRHVPRSHTATPPSHALMNLSRQRGGHRKRFPGGINSACRASRPLPKNVTWPSHLPLNMNTDERQQATL